MKSSRKKKDTQLTLKQRELELCGSIYTLIFLSSKYYVCGLWLVESVDTEEPWIWKADSKLYTDEPPRCSGVNCVTYRVTQQGYS